MKTKIIFTSALLLIAVSLCFTSCKKQDRKPKNANAATDNAAADNAFAGIWKQISIVADSSSTIKSMATTLSGCATGTITPWDLTTWPKTVVLNFGTVNCLGSDYVNRRGIVTAVFSGPYADSNTVITVTTTNYYHNDYKIEGTQIITNKGHISSGHLLYNVVVNDAHITNTSGGVSTWSTNQNRVWYAGESTALNIFDDVYMISGNASGISVDGEAYNIVTNTDLRVNVGCHWIVSGQFTLTLASYPTYPIVFDYGTGACDGNATATLDGTTYNISMY
jgi:hypothetical protein